jgi:hypothetical protein
VNAAARLLPPVSTGTVVASQTRGEVDVTKRRQSPHDKQQQQQQQQSLGEQRQQLERQQLQQHQQERQQQQQQRDAALPRTVQHVAILDTGQAPATALEPVDSRKRARDDDDDAPESDTSNKRQKSRSLELSDHVGKRADERKLNRKAVLAIANTSTTELNNPYHETQMFWGVDDKGKQYVVIVDQERTHKVVTYSDLWLMDSGRCSQMYSKLYGLRHDFGMGKTGKDQEPVMRMDAFGPWLVKQLLTLHELPPEALDRLVAAVPSQDQIDKIKNTGNVGAVQNWVNSIGAIGRDRIEQLISVQFMFNQVLSEVASQRDDALARADHLYNELQLIRADLASGRRHVQDGHRHNHESGGRRPEQDEQPRGWWCFGRRR